MWPFRTKNRAAAIDAEGISRALHAHKLAIEQLGDDLAALRKQHEALRGRFYASGAHKATVEAPPTPQSKAEVLRAAGYMPGRPFKHDP